MEVTQGCAGAGAGALHATPLQIALLPPNPSRSIPPARGAARRRSRGAPPTPEMASRRLPRSAVSEGVWQSPRGILAAPYPRSTHAPWQCPQPRGRIGPLVSERANGPRQAEQGMGCHGEGGGKWCRGKGAGSRDGACPALTNPPPAPAWCRNRGAPKLRQGGQRVLGRWRAVLATARSRDEIRSPSRRLAERRSYCSRISARIATFS